MPTDPDRPHRHPFDDVLREIRQVQREHNAKARAAYRDLPIREKVGIDRDSRHAWLLAFGVWLGLTFLLNLALGYGIWPSPVYLGSLFVAAGLGSVPMLWYAATAKDLPWGLRRVAAAFGVGLAIGMMITSLLFILALPMVLLGVSPDAGGADPCHKAAPWNC